MPRGGRREGAGGKPTWKNGKTKTIRVPVALADQIIEIARELDENGFLEPVTASKFVDFSGVSISKVDGRLAVFLSDLVMSGFEIKPDRLANVVVDEVYKKQLEEANKTWV